MHVLVSESWVGTKDSPLPPSQDSDRGEALVIGAVTPERGWWGTSKITRAEGTIGDGAGMIDGFEWGPLGCPTRLLDSLIIGSVDSAVTKLPVILIEPSAVLGEGDACSDDDWGHLFATKDGFPVHVTCGLRRLPEGVTRFTHCAGCGARQELLYRGLTIHDCVLVKTVGAEKAQGIIERVGEGRTPDSPRKLKVKALARWRWDDDGVVPPTCQQVLSC